jgi:hypothetical protein
MKRTRKEPVTSSHADALPREIGRPATNALAFMGVTRLSQLTNMTEKEVLALHGVGPKAVRILREILQEGGRSFREPPSTSTTRRGGTDSFR